MRTFLTFQILIILLSINCHILEAQEGEELAIRYPEQYLFPDFTVGTVAMKAGKDIYLLLNYSTVLEKMMFLQKGQVYEMLNYSNVDTVYIQGKKFIPYNRIFLEVAVEGKIPLFIRHAGRVYGPSRPAAYGGKSDVSSSTYLSYLGTSGEPFRMKNIEEINVKHGNVYLIVIKDKRYSFISKKQFIKLFPENKNLLNQFIKHNKVNFDESDDVTRLVKYCNSVF
ncbi:MAG: hypothetical protein ACUVTX_07375 [Bacteroidales bacterium]